MELANGSIVRKVFKSRWGMPLRLFLMVRPSASKCVQ
jgi:hypothetical protein